MVSNHLTASLSMSIVMEFRVSLLWDDKLIARILSPPYSDSCFSAVEFSCFCVWDDTIETWD